MAELAGLKKNRSVKKGLLTRLVTFANEIPDNATISVINTRLSRARELLRQFEEIEDQIFHIDDKEESEMIDVEENFYIIESNLSAWINEHNLQENQNEAPINLLGEPNAQNNSANVRLPKIDLPVFSGEDYKDWPGFFDLYCNMVHNNQKLSATQKFVYLKGACRGEALKAIQNFVMNDLNYIQAINKLRERYDRKRLIVNDLIKHIFNHPSIHTATSTNIKSLLDTADEIVRGIKFLGAQAESKDPWLIYLLVQKLDEESRMLWNRESASIEFPTLKEFFDFLIHRSYELDGIQSTQKNKVSKTSGPVKSFVGAATHNCPVCQTNQHKLFECPTFKQMKPEERKTLMQNQRRCFNCLNNCHTVDKCFSKNRCRICQRKHNTLLHLDSANSPTTNVMQNNGDMNKHQPHSSNSVNTLQASVDQITLLPTAIVNVKNSLGSWKRCRALLDSGSQTSFITSDCIQQLRLLVTNAKIAIKRLGQTPAGASKGRTMIVKKF